MRGEAELAALHRLKRRFSGDGYRAVCSCAWIGELRPTAELAEADGRTHEEAAISGR